MRLVRIQRALTLLLLVKMVPPTRPLVGILDEDTFGLNQAEVKVEY